MSKTQAVIRNEQNCGKWKMFKITLKVKTEIMLIPSNYSY